MKRLLLVLLLAACDSDPSGPVGPVLDGVDDWRVAIYDADGLHARTWYCDAYEITTGGALVCYLSGGGLSTIPPGTFVLTPMPR